jgi:ketosteroid isomerase-like protein
MRYWFIILSFIVTASSSAQSKQTRTVLSQAALLERAVFETRDSLTLDKLFATTVTYTQPDSKMESGEAVIRSILNNRSVYINQNALSPYDVKENGDSIIVKHFYKAAEKKTDGTQTILNLSLESVWAKEKGKWKLFRFTIYNKEK